MTPELQAALRRIGALEEAIKAIRAQLSASKPQQISRPLDLASAQVIKDALEQIGFTYP